MRRMLAALRGSLFVKMYLTLLASLAIVAVVGAVLVRMAQDAEDRGWRGRQEQFLTAMLPANADPGDQRLILQGLSRAFGADLTLFDAERRRIAAAGRPLSPRILDSPRRHWREDGVFTARLPDGRYVAARLEAPPFGGGGNPLAWLALIAVAIGIAAYPVVRRLTRRLEAVRAGVEHWGDGVLATRVPVSGKDEVAAVARTFNLAADRVERMIAAHRALLANASHELRSPLARLRMAIDLYERAADEKTKGEIVQSLGELDGLIDEILLASRLDHVEGLTHREPVDLLALATEEGARNGVPVAGVPALVDGEPRLLTRLVRNLMLNALRHGGPPVETEVRGAEGMVELRVRDHGQGIAEEERERIFEPFHRPAGRSESAGGWGLGLSLVRQIAAHHRATVRLETPPAGGACFVVVFPEYRPGSLAEK
jgi:two-component system OmpR family sensor kinase